TRGNKSFFFPNTSFNYAVKVSDKEEGSLTDGNIAPEEVAVTIDYLEEGYDKVIIAQGHKDADASADRFAVGKQLMEESDCKSCHLVDKKSIGPMYIDVAEKCKDDPDTPAYLAEKIINVGSGVRGEVAMAAHPTLTQEQAAS